jgi:HEXXH motif-containing protein
MRKNLIHAGDSMVSPAPIDDLVASYIADRGKQDYKRMLFVKYALMGEALREAGAAGDSVVDYIEQQLGILKTLPGDVFVEEGTTFFWMNVFRCRSDVRKGAKNLESYARHLVMQAFDSYFPHLTDGTVFTLPAVADSDIILPRLGIRIPAPDKQTLLRRLDSANLVIEAGDASLAFKLGEIPPEHSIAKLPVPGQKEAVLLRVKDPALFEHEYIETICLDENSAVSLNQKIGRALDMIAEADPSLSSQINGSIKWYFPIITKNPNAIHNSFTAKRLSAGMFLSGCYRFMPLLEAIVHEYHHSELNMLMATREVLSEDDDRLYYSPWREDARTLFGLFHAIHVFSQVEAFYARAEQSPAFENYREFISERRTELCLQLRIALRQLRENELPAFGRDIYRFILDQLDRHEREISGFSQAWPQQMIDHLEKWCKTYPELVAEVSMPSGFQIPKEVCISEQS